MFWIGLELSNQRRGTVKVICTTATTKNSDNTVQNPRWGISFISTDAKPASTAELRKPRAKATRPGSALDLGQGRNIEAPTGSDIFRKDFWMPRSTVSPAPPRRQRLVRLSTSQGSHHPSLLRAARIGAARRPAFGSIRPPSRLTTGLTSRQTDGLTRRFPFPVGGAPRPPPLAAVCRPVPATASRV